MTAILNLDIYRRSDFAFGINLKDSTNANENLTGKTILSQIWDVERTQKIEDVTTTITSATGGNITWELSDIQTANLWDKTYAYDVLKIHANGKRKQIITGTINMKQGYTEE